jgi:hypothetical protein
MALFGSQSSDARKIFVKTWVDDEGFINLEVSSVYYGKVKPGGDTLATGFPDETRTAEALLGLVALECGRSETEVAKLIADYREWISKRSVKE